MSHIFCKISLLSHDLNVFVCLYICMCMCLSVGCCEFYFIFFFFFFFLRFILADILCFFLSLLLCCYFFALKVVGIQQLLSLYVDDVDVDNDDDYNYITMAVHVNVVQKKNVFIKLSYNRGGLKEKFCFSFQWSWMISLKQTRNLKEIFLMFSVKISH